MELPDVAACPNVFLRLELSCQLTLQQMSSVCNTLSCLPDHLTSSICLQGHALLTRHMGSSLPCPNIDFTGGAHAVSTKCPAFLCRTGRM